MYAQTMLINLVHKCKLWKNEIRKDLAALTCQANEETSFEEKGKTCKCLFFPFFLKKALLFFSCRFNDKKLKELKKKRLQTLVGIEGEGFSSVFFFFNTVRIIASSYCFDGLLQ